MAFSKNSNHVFHWAGVLLELPPRRRFSFAELLNETYVCRKPLTNRVREQLRSVERLSVNAVYRHRMCVALQLVLRGYPLDFLLIGFEIANEIERTSSFSYYKSYLAFDSDVCSAFNLYLRRSPANWYDMRLWRKCIEWPTTGDILLHPQWQALPYDARAAILIMFADIKYSKVILQELHNSWQVMFERFPEFCELLERIPCKYHSQAIELVEEVIDEHQRSSQLQQQLTPTFQLLTRLCKEPFSEHEDLTIYQLFLNLDSEQLQQLIDAEDASHQKLLNELDRENDENLLSDGLEILIKLQPQRVTHAFKVCPSALINTAKSLGKLGESVQQEAIAQWAHHPFLNNTLDTYSLKELVDLIQEHRPRSLTNPVPKKVRLWAEEKYELTQTQQERARHRLIADLTPFSWELLRYLTLERIAEGLPVKADSPTMEHALRLYGVSEDNRRSFRRFLKAYLNGHHTYIQDHPVNRQWLDKHPWLDIDRWLQGITLEWAHSEAGEVTLKVESDPLEVMRMGTHVGSCLGLGGVNSDSAIAVALDINKQVIYARNQKGSVQARQMVALTEDARLLCYEIYVVNDSEHWKDLFKTYDKKFAETLGVTIYRSESGKSEPTPKQLLSSFWYDDGAWDFKS